MKKHIYLTYLFKFKHRQHNNISKVLSLSLFLLGTKICELALNNLSTGADNGRVVLYLKKTFLTIGNVSKICNSFFFCVKI